MGLQFELLVAGAAMASARAHGALGWSSVGLIRGQGYVALLDSGGYGYRGLVRRRLAERGLAPDDITHLLLTHSHWDHICNVPLFARAAVVISRAELEWAQDLPPGDEHVAELHVAEIGRSSDVVLVSDGDEPVPGVRVMGTRGHTPGHVSYLVAARPRPVVFAGDAAKNAAEIATGSVAMTMDAAASRASIERLRAAARATGALVVPGHGGVVRAGF